MKRYICSAVTDLGDEDIEIRETIASDPNTPVRELIRLSTDHNLMVRCAVAKNPSTPSDILVKLLDSDVCYYAASNPSLPVEVIEQLASGGDLKFRDAIARNPSTPVSILCDMADSVPSNNWYLLRRLASNPNLPDDIRHKIVGELNDETVFTITLDAPSVDTATWDAVCDCAAAAISGLGQGYFYNGIDSNDQDDPECFKIYIFSSWIPLKSDCDKVGGAIKQCLEQHGYNVLDIEAELL